MRVVSHVGRTAKAGESPSCYRRRVCVRVHLQRRTNKPIDGILPSELTQDAVRTEAAVPSQKKDIRARRNVFIHSHFAAKTVNAFDPTAFYRRDHCGVRVECPVLADFSPQSERLAVGRQKKFDGGGIETNPVIQRVNLMAFVYAANDHHRDQNLQLIDMAWVACEKRFDCKW